ncbi:helix-turn-helix domain-containing protein [Agreia sp. VKM Ac-1783]|uniref:winged helix-turn-helix transcriptional regulator n=1 Tax=Agreia sp. VKM Ac-1783 TaxID=1938889 RepID=UPI000A2ACB36|nr:helix-turn-helix domain-containing protein [Agreia sp. VKM Ac-1783]SMQ71388.1 transcriptional regulator, HxlR family [Agreia sp. VKM Ac-1783]
MTTSVLGKDPLCPVARSLEVLGEKWTILVVREALAGVTRFSDFQQRLGVAKDVLAARLATLVEFDVLERRSYRAEGERERFEYLLTQAGRDLGIVLASLAQWGDTHRPTGFGPVVEHRERGTGDSLHVAFVTKEGREVALDSVEAVSGPGATAA